MSSATKPRSLSVYAATALASALLVTSVNACESALGLDDAVLRPSLDAATVDAAPDGGDGRDAAPEASSTPPLPYVVSRLEEHTCAVTADHRAYCWGKNADGQLGDGTTEDRASPVWVGPFDDVVDVAAGMTHSCLVRGSGDLYCWGKNDRGQLGDGTKVDRSEASKLTMSDVVKVGVGGWHSCALTRIGTVRCWGDNYYGNYGTGTFESSANATYADVPGLTDVRSLAVGWTHTCAATEQGHVYCWGHGKFGMLGHEVDGSNGSPDPNDPGSPTPTRVEGLSDVVEVAAGAGHTCATTSDGRVWCWGRADVGQLGTGLAELTRTTPAPVKGDLTYAVYLAAGDFVSCATLSGGKVRCWGGNNFGQLGEGDTTPGDGTPAPASVWLSDVVRIATGDHACAWRGDGKLLCWGRNDVGQLGLGLTSEYELQPREVTFPTP